MTTNLLSSSFTRFRVLPKAAFSLVEVVLAVGIMSLGVVTILGLLPHGLNISRETANELSETRIIDQIVGEVQAGDWETMGGIVSAGTSGQIRFFDDQGLEISQGDPDLASTVVYVVRVRIPQSASNAGYQMPSNLTAGSPNPNLRRISIEVVAAPLTQFNFDNPPPGLKVKKFTQLVAKMRVDPTKAT